MALTKVQNTGIADDAVTTDKIENSTVVAADLAASSVTNAKIATGTIGNTKLTNSSITVNGSSISLGGSASLKHIDWQAVTVADGSTQLTAVAGRGYFLDTNTGVIEVLLPSSPSRGDTFVFADYSGTFATNNIIINTEPSVASYVRRLQRNFNIYGPRLVGDKIPHAQPGRPANAQFRLDTPCV